MYRLNCVLENGKLLGIRTYCIATMVLMTLMIITGLSKPVMHELQYREA